MASQIAELQDELAAVRATATGDVGITEEELMEAVTAKEVAESERALVAEDLLHSQTRAVQLQKEMQTLQDEMQTVRQASVTAAATDRTALQRDNAALEEQLREAREEKKQLEEQLAKIKADVDKDSSMAASIRPPSGQPPPESKVRAVVEERTKAAGSEVPIVEDNDIIDLGQIWGMDFTWLGKFRWIPEKALVSALPVGWRQLADGERRPYYYELASGKSTYTHPNDAFFRDLFLKLRADLEAEQQRQAEVVQLHAEASSTIESLAAQREQLAAAEEELKRKEEDVARVRQEADNERKAKLGALEEERRRVRDEEVRRLAARVARGLQVQAKISTDGRPPLPPTATGKPGEDTVALKQEADAVNHQAMLEYAEYLGMDVTEDEHLLWIAEMALNAPVPDGWEELFDEQGHSFFHHAEKDVSQYEHPLDESFRQYYRKMKGVDGSDGAAGSPRPTSKK